MIIGIDKEVIYKYREVVDNWLNDPCYDLEKHGGNVYEIINLSHFEDFVKEYGLFDCPIGAILLFHKLLNEKADKA